MTFPPLSGGGGLIREADKLWLDNEAERRRLGDYVLLGEATADGTSVTLTVSDLPQTHQNLLILFHGSNAGSVFRTARVRFNGVGANYSWLFWGGVDNAAIAASSSVGSGVTAEIRVGNLGDDGNLSVMRMEVADYASNRNKAVTFQHGGRISTAGGGSHASSGWGTWVDSAAITSVSYISTTDAVGSGSTLRVYGIGALRA